MMRILAIAAALTCVSSSALADTYSFQVVGTISNIYSVDPSFKEVTRSTTLKDGDIFASSFIFDTNNYGVASLFDADPTINIYNGSVTNLTYIIGSFGSSYAAAESNFSSVQLWNNYVGTPEYGNLPPTDLFSINAGRYISSAMSPVDFGTTGPVFVTSSFLAFDNTATARNSDLLSEITPLSRFRDISASGGFVDSASNVTSFSINNISARITAISVVPEPSSWIMLLTGFAMIGAGLRYRRRSTKAVYA